MLLWHTEITAITIKWEWWQHGVPEVTKPVPQTTYYQQQPQEPPSWPVFLFLSMKALSEICSDYYNKIHLKCQQVVKFKIVPAFTIL